MQVIVAPDPVPTPHQDVVPDPAAGRPGRPRSEKARLAVLDAAADLLDEGGLAAATIEGIAARAGVSKVTIYKWWPTRGAVAIDAYFHRYRQTGAFADTGDIRADLTGQIQVLIRAFRGRAGQLMAELIGQAQTDAVLADELRARWIEPRRTATAAVLRRAVARGELKADLDVAIVMDQLYGPVYYRLTMGHESLTPRLADRLVTSLLDGIRAD